LLCQLFTVVPESSVLTLNLYAVYNTLQCTGRLISGIAKFFPLTGKLLLFLIKLASNFGTDGFVKGLLFFPGQYFF
jgi:hypothetical protein